jgi:hypothetical protein
MKITASFVDFSETTNVLERPMQRDAAFWRTELGDLQAAGITDLVIARSVVLGRAHYHSSIFEEWSETDALAQVMEAAGALGLGVYLGLDINTCFWDVSRGYPATLRAPGTGSGQQRRPLLEQRGDVHLSQLGRAADARAAGGSNCHDHEPGTDS